MDDHLIKTPNEIIQYAHCGQCIQDLEGACISPREYADLSIGFTGIGLQIWCNRHDCNVVHIDFEGAMHPADTSHTKK